MPKRIIENSPIYQKANSRKSTHGLSGHSIYYMWLAMKRRCNNPKDLNYRNYGARGITVCKEWEDVEVFFHWCINNGYQVGRVIDRINNNKGYSPENCRFVSRTENQRNRRVTIRYEYNGEQRTIAEWSAILDIPLGKLTHQVVIKNRTIEDVLTNGVKVKKEIDIEKAILDGSNIKSLIKKTGIKNGWVVKKMISAGFNINECKFSNKISGERGFFTDEEIEFITKLINKLNND